MLEKESWIFTCKMIPVQFDCFLDNDNFKTLDGSEHSCKNCGCYPISKEYAMWFLSNEIHKNYNELKDISKLSCFKKIDKYHYVKTYGNLEFHYVGKFPLKKRRQSPSSYKRRFYTKYLIYKGFRLELTNKYDPWDLYRQYIKKLCELENIKFEGI